MELRDLRASGVVVAGSAATAGELEYDVALAAVYGMRRVRRKPWVASPWSAEQVQRALRQLARRISGCGPDEVVVFVDEGELHLNPKGGIDWCVRGYRRAFRPPGNERRLYLTLAVGHGSRGLTSVHNESTRCRLFLKLLAALLRRSPHKRRIYVVLDNAAIHRAKAVQRYLE